MVQRGIRPLCGGHWLWCLARCGGWKGVGQQAPLPSTETSSEAACCPVNANSQFRQHHDCGRLARPQVAVECRKPIDLLPNLLVLLLLPKGFGMDVQKHRKAGTRSKTRQRIYRISFLYAALFGSITEWSSCLVMFSNGNTCNVKLIQATCNMSVHADWKLAKSRTLFF